MGSGFEKGTIFGKTRALVKQKVEEICEQIEDDIISRYVQRIGSAFTGKTGKYFLHRSFISILTIAIDEPRQQPFSSLSRDAVPQSHSPEDWTEEDKRSARAAWDLDEAKKRPLKLELYNYRLGKFCSMIEASPRRNLMGQVYRSDPAQDYSIDDGRYTYTDKNGWGGPCAVGLV